MELVIVSQALFFATCRVAQKVQELGITNASSSVFNIIELFSI